MKRERITSLELKEVTQQFDKDAPLFADISLQLPLGEVLVFEGNPGSGKSILLKILAGLVEPTSGSVFYNGLSLKDLSFEEFAPLRLSTAFSFDDGGLLMNKTLEENMKIGLLYHNGWRSDRSQKLFQELVDSFDLTQFLHLRPAQVPSSIRKLTGLVRTFLHNAQILLLDDPSLGIGDKGAQALNYWLERYRRDGKHDEIIVIASSDQAFVKGLNCRHMKIEKGALVLASRATKDAA